MVEKKDVKKVLKYNKKELLESNKYANRKDLLRVLLKDEQVYSFAQVDKEISDFMKGKVK